MTEEPKENPDSKAISLTSENFEEEFMQNIKETEADLLLDSLGGEIPNLLLRKMPVGSMAILY